MNRKQVATIALGILLLGAILVGRDMFSVGEVVSRVPAGPDTEVVTFAVYSTPTLNALLALVALGTVIAVIRLRNRAAS